MIFDIFEIIDDGAPLLLSGCESWTIEKVEELRPSASAAWMEKGGSDLSKSGVEHKNMISQEGL